TTSGGPSVKVVVLPQFVPVAVELVVMMPGSGLGQVSAFTNAPHEGVTEIPLTVSILPRFTPVFWYEMSILAGKGPCPAFTDAGKLGATPSPTPASAEPVETSIPAATSTADVNGPRRVCITIFSLRCEAPPT